MAADPKNEDNLKKKQFDVTHQKFEDEPEYRDVKPADQSGDNDMDRTSQPVDDADKKATDEAYLKNQTGQGTEPS